MTGMAKSSEMLRGYLENCCTLGGKSCIRKFGAKLFIILYRRKTLCLCLRFSRVSQLK